MNKFSKILSILLCFSLSISIFCISAFADNFGTYGVWWDKPELSDHCGYLEVLVENRTNPNDRFVEGFFYNLSPLFPQSCPNLEIVISTSSTRDTINFNPLQSSDGTYDGSYWSMGHYRWSSYQIDRATISATGDARNYSWPYTTYKIVGYHFEGYGVVLSTGSTGAFTTDYGKFNSQIKAVLNDISDQNTTLLSVIRSIFLSSSVSSDSIINKINTALGTTNTRLSTINTTLGTTNSRLSTINSSIGVSNNHLTNLETKGNTIIGYLEGLYEELVTKQENASDSFSSSGGASVGNISSDLGGLSGSMSGSLTTGESVSSVTGLTNSNEFKSFWSQSTYDNLDSVQSGSPRRSLRASADNGSQIVDYSSDYWSHFGG